MDDPRAQTLHSLEAFIESQRALLARQRADIETLQRLKTDLTQRPSQTLLRLNGELNDPAFHLSEQIDCRLNPPKDIDWSSFKKSDARPLRTFSQRINNEIHQREVPLAKQRSELSDLQKLVKHARRTIVDPILVRFQNMSSPEPESEEEIDPIERQRELERQKIRELKRRKIKGGLSLPLSAVSGSMGVFIRHDVDEDAMDVDVSIDDAETEPTQLPMEVDPVLPQPRPYATKAIPTSSPPPPAPPPLPAKRQASVRAAPKVKREEEDTYIPRKKGKATRKSPTPDWEDEEPAPAPKAKSRGASTKPKPETYKQAWSTSEQNLLEQLLEEIPEGQKFRWQQISQAMGGRRTPRQVASRVQKYFEKLKKFSLL